MKRFISFGEIGQFRNCIKDITHAVRYKGEDDNGESVYDPTIKLPLIKAVGSEKIHGTNASVCYSNPDGFWVQSKKSIITPEKDNAGCAFTAEKNKNEWMPIIQKLAKCYNIDLNKNIVTMFFEWARGVIQKNSACSDMDKRAVIFRHFKVSPFDEGQPAVWLPTLLSTTWVDHKPSNIFNIMNYKTWEIVIDFENPLLSVNKMVTK